MSIVLTDPEREVLAHVLIIETPEQWVARNEARDGPEKTRQWLDAKVRRWRPHYESAKEREGRNYRTARQWHELEAKRDDGLARAPQRDDQ